MNIYYDREKHDDKEASCTWAKSFPHSSPVAFRNAALNTGTSPARTKSLRRIPHNGDVFPSSSLYKKYPSEYTDEASYIYFNVLTSNTRTTAFEKYYDEGTSCTGIRVPRFHASTVEGLAMSTPSRGCTVSINIDFRHNFAYYTG